MAKTPTTVKTDEAKAKEAEAQAAAKQAEAEAKAQKAKDAAEKKAKAAAEKAEKDAAKAKKKAEADRLKAEKEAKAAEARDIQNGVPRPMSGVTQQVWIMADKMSQEAETPVERAALVKALEGKVEVGTVHTQYGRWRKYYGLSETKEQRSARLATEKAAKEQAKTDKKAAKDAEKNAATGAADVDQEQPVGEEAEHQDASE